MEDSDSSIRLSVESLSYSDQGRGEVGEVGEAGGTAALMDLLH